MVIKNQNHKTTYQCCSSNHQIKFFTTEKMKTMSNTITLEEKAASRSLNKASKDGLKDSKAAFQTPRPVAWTNSIRHTARLSQHYSPCVYARRPLTLKESSIRHAGGILVHTQPHHSVCPFLWCPQLPLHPPVEIRHGRLDSYNVNRQRSSATLSHPHTLCSLEIRTPTPQAGEKKSESW